MSTNERDELAELAESIRSGSLGTSEIVAAILAAGYSKPRTITTTEELDELPTGSVVLNSLHEAATKHGNRWHFPAIRHGFMTWAVSFPATVLYVPEPQP